MFGNYLSNLYSSFKSGVSNFTGLLSKKLSSAFTIPESYQPTLPATISESYKRAQEPKGPSLTQRFLAKAEQKQEIPTAGGALFGQPVTPTPSIPSEEAARINAESPVPISEPAPIPTTGDALLGSAVTPPEIIGQGGISAPAGVGGGTPSSPSAPGGGPSGYNAGLVADLANFAQSIGVPSNRINPQTGEIINPTEEEIKKYNERFRTLYVSPEEKGITSPITAPSLQTAGVTPPSLPSSTAQGVNEAYVTSVTADLANMRKAVEDAYQRQINDYQTKIDAANKRIDEFTKKEEGVLGDVKALTEPFRQQLETSERERLHINENFEANQKLVGELESLLTEGNVIIEQIKGTPGVITSITNRKVASTMEKISARAGVIQAVMSARNGQIAQAYSMIDRSVNAINADRQDQLKYYDALYKFYDTQKDEEGKKLITLTKDQKDYMNAQISLIENDMKRSQDYADNIKKAMSDPDKALAYASAGVTLNDSPEAINYKLAQYAYSKEISDTSNKMAEKGYSYLAPGQTAPTNSEVVTTTDTQGEQRQWYKAKEAYDQTYTKDEGNDLVFYGVNKKTGQVDEIKRVSGGAPGNGVDESTISYYVNAISNRDISLENVPADVRNEVAKRLGGANLANQATEGFEAIRGKDGYVSPQDWSKLQDTWIAQGGNLASFLSNFRKYVNPANPQDYKGVK